MLDLVALVIDTIEIKIAGKTYTAPRGINSLPIEAVAAGKSAQEALTKLEGGSGELTPDDLERVYRFLSLASTIPVDILRGKPMNVLMQIVSTILPAPPKAESNVADPPQG